MSGQDTFTPSTPPGRSGSSAYVPGSATGAAGGEGEAPVIRDKRRLDPETGQVRQPSAPAGAGTDQPSAPQPAEAGGFAPEPGAGEPSTGEPAEPGAPAEPGGPAGGAAPDAATDQAAELEAAVVLAQERLDDMQRLQAEYANYRRRVDRDRDVAREAGIVTVLEALLPALDDIALARQHGDLDGGPFAAIAEKLEAALARVGMVSYGQEGEEFDPAVHEALLNSESPDVAVTTVTKVLQSGYRTATRVLRPARVAVASPA